jgi:hypothetical protein
MLSIISTVSDSAKEELLIEQEKEKMRAVS